MSVHENDLHEMWKVLTTHNRMSKKKGLLDDVDLAIESSLVLHEASEIQLL